MYLSATDGTLTGTKASCGAFPDGRYTIGGGFLCGATWFTGIAFCTDGVWTVQLTSMLGVVSSFNLSWDGDCETLIMTGSLGGCALTFSP